MREREYIRHDDKAASRLAPKGGDGRFDFYVAMNGRNACRDLECPGRRLKWRHMYRLYRHGSGVRIEHDCGPLEPRRDLREQLKPLASHRGFVPDAEAGDVPARLVEPRDDAAGDGLGRVSKNDRDRLRLPLEGNSRHGPACEYDVRVQADQLLRERSCPIDVSASPPNVDPHVVAIGPTQVRKGLRERRVAALLLRIVFVVRHGRPSPKGQALKKRQRTRYS